ncbi:hypothetical protein N7468_005461 [Penicillium chermesinum]|uniref:Probable glucan endo-1,3-beta-glucosidase eglC n=1 Tax=Penicillium chermesinum TaxID=63820 RepID=A0A9W9NZF6_9EURO|nr:uncharacterized protein N7468_005461 [Penicillium chermesinum]KAJ5232505.1 hypothetical protein N7468_005461 [Penicillium chermesinum]
MQLNLLALALSVATAEAAYKGFNYGATNGDGSTRVKADFTAQFQTAKGLVGAPGMTSARLYTMIQGGTTNSPIEAIEAAIEEQTTLLLGLWTSGGGIDNEIAALKNSINQYGDDLAKLVVGISVGSEDLYRNSPTGIKAHSGPGMNPDDLVSAIKAVKAAVAGTSLGSSPIGHVDTWNAWTNSSNSAVIDAVDFIGFDTYPFYQTTDDNSIDNAKSLFDEAMQKTKQAAGGKPIWVTESGWPVSGPSEGAAVASIPNAKKFWDQVACSLFDSDINTWWYILQDYPASPSFGVVGQQLTTKPFSTPVTKTAWGVSPSVTGSVSRSAFRTSMTSTPLQLPSASAVGQFNAAARPTGSIFGAVIAAFALAIIV